MIPALNTLAIGLSKNTTLIKMRGDKGYKPQYKYRGQLRHSLQYSYFVLGSAKILLPGIAGFLFCTRQCRSRMVCFPGKVLCWLVMAISVPSSILLPGTTCSLLKLSRQVQR